MARQGDFLKDIKKQLVSFERVISRRLGAIDKHIEVLDNSTQNDIRRTYRDENRKIQKMSELLNEILSSIEYLEKEHFLLKEEVKELRKGKKQLHG